MNAEQKQQFHNALRNIIGAEDSTMLQSLDQMANEERYGIWTSVGKRIGVTQRVAADYFHNTWSKQFYQRPHQYKSQIREMLQDVLRFEIESIAVDQVLSAMFEKHGNIFHKQELRTYIKRQVGKKPDFTGIQIDQLLEALAVMQ